MGSTRDSIHSLKMPSAKVAAKKKADEKAKAKLGVKKTVKTKKVSKKAEKKTVKKVAKKEKTKKPSGAKPKSAPKKKRTCIQLRKLWRREVKRSRELDIEEFSPFSTNNPLLAHSIQQVQIKTGVCCP